jgi:hypothetical protein
MHRRVLLLPSVQKTIDCALILTPHDTQNKHHHDQHYDEDDLEASKDVFELAKDLPVVSEQIRHTKELRCQHALTGNMLMHITMTRNNDIQTALSTFSPVLQFKNVLWSS